MCYNGSWSGSDEWEKEAISLKKLVTNPIIISILLGVCVYLLQIPMPSVVRSAVSDLAVKYNVE